MPAMSVKICTTDVPWMNQSLKSLIIKKRRSTHIALTQLSLDPIETLSTEWGKSRAILRLKNPAPKGKKPDRVVGWKRLSGLKTYQSESASQINLEGLSDLPFQRASLCQSRSSLHSGVWTASSSRAGFSWVWLARNLKCNRAARAEYWKSSVKGRPVDRNNAHLAPERTLWFGGLYHHGNLERLMLNNVFVPSGKWLTWPPCPKRNQRWTSKRNWDRYPWHPVFLK